MVTAASGIRTRTRAAVARCVPGPASCAPHSSAAHGSSEHPELRAAAARRAGGAVRARPTRGPDSGTRTGTRTAARADTSSRTSADTHTCTHTCTHTRTSAGRTTRRGGPGIPRASSPRVHDR